MRSFLREPPTTHDPASLIRNVCHTMLIHDEQGNFMDDGSSILIFPILPGIENSDEMNYQFSVHLTDGVNNLFATRNMNVDGLVDRVLSAATDRFFNLIRSDLLNTDPNEFFTTIHRNEMIRVNVSRDERSVVGANSPNVLHS